MVNLSIVYYNHHTTFYTNFTINKHKLLQHLSNLPSVSNEHEEKAQYKVADVAPDVVEGTERENTVSPRMAAQTVVVAKVIVAAHRQQLHWGGGSDVMMMSL